MCRYKQLLQEVLLVHDHLILPVQTFTSFKFLTLFPCPPSPSQQHVRFLAFAARAIALWISRCHLYAQIFDRYSNSGLVSSVAFGGGGNQ